MTNSVDPDETPHSVSSHLGLHCLLRPVSPNTYIKYGNIFTLNIWTVRLEQIMYSDQTAATGTFCLESRLLAHSITLFETNHQIPKDLFIL